MVVLEHENTYLCLSRGKVEWVSDLNEASLFYSAEQAHMALHPNVMAALPPKLKVVEIFINPKAYN